MNATFSLNGVDYTRSCRVDVYRPSVTQNLMTLGQPKLVGSTPDKPEDSPYVEMGRDPIDSYVGFYWGNTVTMPAGFSGGFWNYLQLSTKTIRYHDASADGGNKWYINQLAGRQGLDYRWPLTGLDAEWQTPFNVATLDAKLGQPAPARFSPTLPMIRVTP